MIPPCRHVLLQTALLVSLSAADPEIRTHERRLRHVDDDVADFLRAMEPLHPLMDPISIQLPASFGPAGTATAGVVQVGEGLFGLRHRCSLDPAGAGYSDSARSQGATS